MIGVTFLNHRDPLGVLLPDAVVARGIGAESVTKVHDVDAPDGHRLPDGLALVVDRLDELARDQRGILVALPEGVRVGEEAQVGAPKLHVVEKIGVVVHGCYPSAA